MDWFVGEFFCRIEYRRSCVAYATSITYVIHEARLYRNLFQLVFPLSSSPCGYAFLHCSTKKRWNHSTSFLNKILVLSRPFISWFLSLKFSNYALVCCKKKKKLQRVKKCSHPLKPTETTLLRRARVFICMNIPKVCDTSVFNFFFLLFHVKFACLLIRAFCYTESRCFEILVSRKNCFFLPKGRGQKIGTKEKFP